MITRPVRERPADQVRTHGVRRAASAPATTRWRSPRCRRPTSAASSRSSAASSTIPVNCGQVSVSLPSLRVDAFTVGIAAQIQKARRTGPHLRPRGGHLAHAPGHQQADPRRRSLRRRRVGLLPGLASDEAVLPHRSPHRDRRGHARHRRVGDERASRSVGQHHKSPSVTVSVGGFVPKPFTPFQWFGQNTSDELQRKINLLRDATRREHGVDLKWHDPEGHHGRGHREPRRSTHRTR